MLFRAHRLFDGRNPKVFCDWVVEVEDGRILDVGPRSRVASGSDAGAVVDLGDVTLLPGLIDAHQHLVFDASDAPVTHLQAQEDAAVLQWMRRAAQRALAAGITTIRDLGDRNYLSLTLRDLFRDGHEVGPRRWAAPHRLGRPLLVFWGCGRWRMAPMTYAGDLMILAGSIWTSRGGVRAAAGITNGQVPKAAESIVPRSSSGDAALVAAPDGRCCEAENGHTGAFVL